MDEHSPSSAMSEDNFGASAFNPSAPNVSQSPQVATSISSLIRDTSSPSFKSVPISPSSASRSASSSAPASPKTSFTSSIGQPWGLSKAEADSGPAETVRHPLMSHRSFSDEDEEDAVSGPSPAKLPTGSAASTTQTFSKSPEAVSSSRPKLNATSLSFGSRSFQGTPDVSSLRKLARQGAWRALVDKVKGAKKQGVLTTPVDELNYATYHLLALIKLRNYGAAASELAAVGDLDATQYCYEEYPSVYPGKSGSMVPFALRWMHADLPHRNGQTATTIERLYALLDFCNSRVESLQSIDSGSRKSSLPLVHAATDTLTNQHGDMPGGDEGTPVERAEPGEHASTEEVGTSGEEEDFGEFVASDITVTGKLLLTWMKRKEAVVCALVGHHLFQKQHVVALQWLNQLLASSPTDTDLLSRVGYVLLQLGDLGGAQQSFSKVDALISDSVDEELLNLAGRNRGLLHFAEKQYSKAFNEFATVLSRSPYDTVSVNNKALCLMYQRELLGATSVLEDSLQSSPQSSLNETLVLNLCSMYELASMNSVESKRALSSWLLTHAPDDFDLSCTRL